MVSREICYMRCYRNGWYPGFSFTMKSWWGRWRLTSLTIVYSTVLIQAQKKKTIKAPRHWPLWGEFAGDRWIPRGIHRWPMNSPHKGPATRKMFPFDHVIMIHAKMSHNQRYLGTKHTVGQSSLNNQGENYIWGRSINLTISLFTTGSYHQSYATSWWLCEPVSSMLVTR